MILEDDIKGFVVYTNQLHSRLLEGEQENNKLHSLLWEKEQEILKLRKRVKKNS